ncbi:MFS transporter [Clostridium sp. HBUAS56010]|uniref:MFS transporter n=1 Tax=Clostridium sp. HBUAS56010 TaxID=2571127 RepID=UPI001177596C|nr:MFS transporter [Clostridium sp. HBUAS56010]
MKQYKICTLVLVLLSFILGSSEFIIVGVLSDIAADLNVPLSKIGTLVTVFGLIYAIGTPFITTFLGKFSHYYSLLILTVIFILGNFMSFVSHDYSTLYMSRIITAIVSGPMISLGLTFGSIIAPPEKKANIISLIFSGFSIASVFGVPIGAWISSVTSWNYAFFTIAVMSLAVLLLMIVILPKVSTNTKGKGASQIQFLKDKRIMVGVLLPMFGGGGIYVFYTYLRPILSDALGYNTHMVSLLLFAYGFTTIISNLMSGLIAQKNGLKKMPVFFLIQALILFGLSIFLRNQISGTIVVMALGITMYLLNSPIQMHYLTVADEYPGSMVLASSFNSIFFNFGISLGSFIGSSIFDHYGLFSIGIGGGILSAITVLLIIFLNRINAVRRHS